MMQVALLRAVNVGGRSSLKMSDLRAVAEELGFTEVRTLLQSGNLVFEAEGKKAPALEGALKAALKKHHGIETDFLVRSANELDAIIAANPFRDEAKAEPSRLLVMFLQDHVAATAVQALRDAFKGPEIIRHKGRELYIVYPDGIGRSKLTGSLIEKRLGTRGTGRNWNTVRNSPIWRARSSLSGKRTHAVLHFCRHAVVAHQLARVAQAERFALHHEQPERVAGFARPAHGARCAPRPKARAPRIEVAQRRECGLQRAAEPAECRRPSPARSRSRARGLSVQILVAAGAAVGRSWPVYFRTPPRPARSLRREPCLLVMRPLDHIGADRLHLVVFQDVAERHHAVVDQRAVDHDRFPGIGGAERRRIAQVGHDAAGHPGVAVTDHAVHLVEVEPALEHLLAWLVGRRIERARR